MLPSLFQEILSSAINSPVKETDKLEIIISAVGNKAKDMFAVSGNCSFNFLIGILITKSILRIFKKCLNKANIDASLAIGFIFLYSKYFFYIITIIIALSILNIPMTSIIAVFKRCRTCYRTGFAEQSVKSCRRIYNIIFSKPFKSGDFVETNSCLRNSRKHKYSFIQKILTTDKKTIYIPNGKVADSPDNKLQ